MESEGMPNAGLLVSEISEDMNMVSKIGNNERKTNQTLTI
jgi:hypothetical protein